jgi:hypothetical protein
MTPLGGFAPLPLDELTDLSRTTLPTFFSAGREEKLAEDVPA